VEDKTLMHDISQQLLFKASEYKSLKHKESTVIVFKKGVEELFNFGVNY